MMLPSNALSVSQKPNMAIRTTRIRKMTSGMKSFLSDGPDYTVTVLKRAHGRKVPRTVPIILTMLP
ncbi:hypothetical protein SAE02_26680 [Skermanella aerolata]|uniref:Uncharacterized protein n=1 Tax=Skermanella aerolata TaxID=393310 RepID=A0A512DQR0_9PROT|nr:hypothetical protein SAE02_26680 [Skermanella aerolata]